MAANDKSYTFLQKTLMLMVALLGLVLITLGVFGNDGIITYMQLNKRYQEMDTRVNDLNRENDRLSAEIQALRDDPGLIERIAREELGMVKPGEILYKVKRGGDQ